jgi:DNA-binding NarL/FixJ family response regulator
MLNNEIQEERRQLIEQLEEEKRLKEEAKAREEEAKIREKDAILNLQKEGLSDSRIASIFNISAEAVRNYLSLE